MDKNKRYNPNLSVILLAVFLVCALAAAVLGLNAIGLVTLPFVSEDTEQTVDDGKEIEKILQSLSNAEKNGETVYMILDSSVVKDVLATGKVTNNYLHEYTITYGDKQDETMEYSVLRKNANFHLLELKDGKILREVLCINGTAEIFDARLGQRATVTNVPSYYFEMSSGIVSAIDLINFIINFHPGMPVEWKLGTVVDCTVEALREESVNMARVTLTYSDHKDIYMLDIDRSTIYSYEVYVGDVRAVSMRTTKVSYDIEGLELDSVLK